MARLKELVIEQQNSETNGRHYVTPQGNRYPSVTTIVGMLNKKHIEEWIARVGEEKANEVKKIAGEHGSRWHDLMEHSLNEGVKSIPLGKEFFAIYPQIVKHIYPRITNIRAVEHRMYSDKTKCAGTVDLVADWDGKLSIIDWKTTSHNKRSEDVASYWMQTSAYAIMLWELYGLKAEKLVLVFNENDKEYYVYEQPVMKWVKQFIELRKRYEEEHGE